MLGLWLLMERRSARVRWVWARRDLLVLAAWHVTAAMSRAGLMDVAIAACVVAAVGVAGRSRVVRGAVSAGDSREGSAEVSEAPLS